MIDVFVPRIGMSMESASLVSWARQVGETIEEGDTIAEIEAEKSVVELPSPATGVIRELLVEVDDDLAPGDIIARIEPA